MPSVVASLQRGHLVTHTSPIKEAAGQRGISLHKQGQGLGTPKPESRAGGGRRGERVLWGLYSLQMLEGGEGLQDPHQFGESLGARDRAQPRKQRAEVRP